MTFNPASFNPFANVTNMSDAQVKRLSQRDEADVPARRPAPAIAPVWAEMAGDLKAAAARWERREADPRDDFARGKAATCLDMAAKLERFGSFVSEAQEGYARKLIAWSLPRQDAQQAAQRPASAPIAAPAVPAPAPAPVVRLQRLFDLMQRLSKLTLQGVIIARKNQDSLLWIKLPNREGVVGKVEGGVLTLFASRIRSAAQVAELTQQLLDIDADPEAAAVLYGKVSGRCAICNRDLTDPESIARGIGPICAEKF